MAGKFELKKATNGQFFFHLKASNGQVILASEQYKEKRGAVRGIESVKKNAPLDNRYERKTAKNGQPYFVLHASNGQVIGQSEMYNTAASMEKGIESVKKNAPEAAVDDKTAA
ncbi:MAG TPA: YegP family protein [Thermoanaerobaculia bacterium]|nr:YegP family protein [Thermoanaerobaculia bacterium]